MLDGMAVISSHRLRSTITMSMSMSIGRLTIGVHLLIPELNFNLIRPGKIGVPINFERHV